jgi:glutamine---fructose-6-phosphate transaminase (isomerizing)
MQEVAARGGNIILMTDAKGAAEATVDSLVTIVLQAVSTLWSAPMRCSANRSSSGTSAC